MLTNNWMRITAWAAWIVAAAAILHIVQILYRPVLQPVLSVLSPVSVAFMLALLLDPTIDRLQRRGMSRGTAVVAVAVLFLVVIAIAATFLVPSLIRQAGELAENMPGYYRQGAKAVNNFMSEHSLLLKRTNLPDTIEGLTIKYNDQIEQAVKRIFANVGSFLAALLGKIVWLVLIPIITVFLLIDIDRIKEKFLLLVDQKHRERTASLASSVGRCFGAYIRGLLSVAFLYGVVCGLAVWALGVPYAIMLGAAAGVLSLVPYIGTISTILLVALIAFVSNTNNPMHALWAALAILILNQAFDNVISPKIVGKAVGIHPALAIIALLIGGNMFGLMGMILAVPVAASIQIVVLEFHPPLKGAEPEQKQKRHWLSFRWLKGKGSDEEKGKDQAESAEV